LSRRLGRHGWTSSIGRIRWRDARKYSACGVVPRELDDHENGRDRYAEESGKEGAHSHECKCAYCHRETGGKMMFHRSARTSQHSSDEKCGREHPPWVAAQKGDARREELHHGEKQEESPCELPVERFVNKRVTRAHDLGQPDSN
jgi:hypothetical protein